MCDCAIEGIAGDINLANQSCIISDPDYLMHHQQYHMKQITIAPILIALMLAAPGHVTAQGLISKKRITVRHYVPRPTDTLELKNSFGTVTVNTWDKNEVMVTATATGIAHTAKGVEDRLAYVTFREDTTRPGKIWWGTSVKSPNSRSNDVNAIDSPYYIRHEWEANADYEVWVPKNMAVVITNSLGDVTLGDMNGYLKLKITFGAVTAKNLLGADKIIELNDCRGKENTINAIERGVLTCNSICALTIDQPINKERVRVEGYWSPLFINKERVIRE